ncbi:MAG: DUF3761 domain-containing protein [Chloroflexota bacterium]|nr:DUF3761 domain-containing protein [Chloroflexota bacterium]
MRIQTGLAALAALILLTASPADAYRHGSKEYYRSTDGSMVHRPTRGNVDYGRVTAVCGDGSRSFSHHHQGTCSHHGGVANWR